MSSRQTVSVDHNPATTLPFRRERPPQYRVAFERVMANLRRCADLLDQQPSLASHLVAELSSRDQHQRQRLVESDSRYHRFEVCDRLIEQSLRLVTDQPEEARGLAKLALSIADQLSSPCGSEGLVRDLQARCWASLANSHRALSESGQALEAFRRASQHLEAGSGDPLEEGQLSELEALLLGEVGELHAAERLLDAQILSYRGFDQQAAVARTLAHKAALLARQGRFDRGAELCREALYSLDWNRHRALGLELRRQLVASLDVVGNDLLIRRELQRSRQLDNDGPGGWSNSERLRLAGRGEARARQSSAARERLERAATGFMARGHLAESFRARLDLATLWVEVGEAEHFARLRRDLDQLLGCPKLERSLATVIDGLSLALATHSSSPEVLSKLRQELSLVVCNPERTFLLGL